MSVGKKLILILAAAVLITGGAAAVILTRPIVRIGRAFQKTCQAMAPGAVLSIYTDDYGIYDVDTWLNDHALILHSEAFPGEDLYYPYIKDKSGSGMEELLGKDAVGRVDTFLRLYYSVCRGGTNKKLLKDLRGLKFEKTDQKELHVDNTAIHRRGLRTRITADLLKRLMADAGETSSDSGDFKDMDVTFYLSGGYVAQIDIAAGENEPVEILFEEKGRRISVTDTDGDEFALAFKDDAQPLSEEGAQDLSQMSEEDLRGFVIRMMIRGSGLSF